MQTLLVVDGTALAFRAFFAVPESIVDRSGKPANVVHGFGSFLLRYLKEEQPTHVGAAFAVDYGENVEADGFVLRNSNNRMNNNR